MGYGRTVPTTQVCTPTRPLQYPGYSNPLMSVDDVVFAAHMITEGLGEDAEIGALDAVECVEMCVVAYCM